MLKEFKEFAFKGNLIDMAVGFILGGAFGVVVKSLVDNVVMPPLGKLIGGVDFSNLKWVIQEGAVPTDAPPAAADGAAAVVATPQAAEVAIYWGQFVQDFISFVALAFVVFIIVKKVVAAMQKEEEAPEPPKQEVLLEEIRDALVKRG